MAAGPVAFMQVFDQATEVIKHGAIRDAALFGWLEANVERLLARDAAALAHVVRRSVEIKAQVVGADERAQKTLYESDLPQSIAWVLGAEGEGMRRLTRENCDTLVRIPMFGTVESLNVSVASGICLYEARRRRMAGC